MTLPNPGVSLSLSQIQTEFGGSNPASLNEYYAGGAYVPAGKTGYYGAIPSSGTISIRDFYGSSKNYNISVTVGFSGTAGVIENYGYDSGVMGSISGDTVTPIGTITGIYTSRQFPMGGGTIDFTWIKFSVVPTAFTSLTIGTGGSATTWTYGVGGTLIGTGYRWAGQAGALVALLGTVVPCVFVQ